MENKSLLDLRTISKQYADKLSKIRIALFDVDGILTNGQLYWSCEEVGFNRHFHTHDGYGIKILKEAGIKVGIITGGDSIGVRKRFEGLGVDHLYMGSEDKRASFEKILFATPEFIPTPRANDDLHPKKNTFTLDSRAATSISIKFKLFPFPKANLNLVLFV